MTRFAVWAPGHRRVELVLDDRRVDMEADPEAADRPGSGPPDRWGWWSVGVEGAGPGTRYRFSVDGGPPRPDPRSRWQPHGVDGPSAVDDPRSFPWSDGGWRGARLAGAVIYELHVGTFSAEGTFEGAIAHLDHLVDLGVTAVEIMPVAEASGERGWGYDGVDLWAPHHAYGGPRGLRRLVDACHARGLAAVLDVVYNHLGPAGNYLAEFGPYFTDRYRTPWGQAVNFDGEGSDGVRRFVIDNALMWLSDYHFDGLRLDAVHAIYDDSALHVLEEMALSVDALADHLGRPLWLIAESDRNDARLVRSREAGGYGLAASWDDDYHHALHSALTGERSGYYADYGSLTQVGRALERVFVYGRDWSPFRRRHHGRPVGDVPASRFVVCAQNHDQVGNRAVGERLAALTSTGRLHVAAALVLLGPCVPMLFQGEEWGASTPFQYFTAHEDPQLGRAVSEGRRREFGAFGWDPADVPDPQDPATFERSRLDWRELASEPHAGLLRWHRRLIALRRAYPELTDGRLDAVEVEVKEEDGSLRLRRGRVTLAVNIGSEAVVVPAVHGGTLALASHPDVVLDDARLVLPPDTVGVVIA
ncbi:MAG TPA: malto-oligosyltrehalose trehalohydrolase [Acidimicrobiales bacterium]|nr:malto-oligosyltrehalose trehalohydrolase [Acidimicrobiales bacterium]